MTPKASEAERRTDMHRRILRAAERCFGEFGPGRTTMVDVARVAGVSRPTVYRYFRDRDALMIEVIARRIESALASASQLLADGESFLEALHASISLLVDRGRADPMIRALIVNEDEVVSSAGVWQVALALSADFWEPVLAAGQQRGELRGDLALPDACSWLAELLLFLVSRSEREGALDTRVVVREFLIPALAAPTRSCLTP